MRWTHETAATCVKLAQIRPRGTRGTFQIQKTCFQLRWWPRPATDFQRHPALSCWNGRMPHSGIADSDTKRPEMPEVTDTKNVFPDTKTLACQLQTCHQMPVKCHRNAIEMPVFSGRKTPLARSHPLPFEVSRCPCVPVPSSSTASRTTARFGSRANALPT